MTESRSSDIRIGISGWRYVPWRGTFYPRSLRQNLELHFASRCVNSIEINGSFYALQTPERYSTWSADTPDDFIFSVKAPRYITHIKRLNDVEKPIADFFASGLLELGEKLGPILWQFPPSFTFDATQFEHFLTLLPNNEHEAKNLGKPRSTSSTLKDKKSRRIRHAIEIRHPSFKDETFIALLRKYNVALVIADTGGRWPQMEDITSDFVYMRLHGDKELYESGYSDSALKHWYERIKTWSQGKQPEDRRQSHGAEIIATPLTTEVASRDVFCYFDNSEKLGAPHDARKVLTKFGLDKNLSMEPGVLPKDLPGSKPAASKDQLALKL